MAGNITKERLEELKTKKLAAEAAVTKATEAVEAARAKVRSAERKAKTAAKDYAAAAFDYMVLTGKLDDPLSAAEPSPFSPSGFDEDDGEEEQQ